MGSTVSADRAACVPCLPGQYGTDESDCEACPVGRYSGQGGLTECIECQSGRHAPSNGSSVCLVCPDYEQSTPDLTACECVTGRFRDAASSQCLRCFAGTDCRLPGETLDSLFVRPGHWRSTASLSDVHSCPVHAACVGTETRAVMQPPPHHPNSAPFITPTPRTRSRGTRPADLLPAREHGCAVCDMRRRQSARRLQ